MQKSGYITSSEYHELAADSLRINYQTPKDVKGSSDYFKEFLRQYMMAKKPEHDNYPSWNKKQFVLDSIAWSEDPLYGWCNKNFKRNGEPYNIYTDGLRIFTTIDTRMQQYAEQAVRKHVGGYLQPQFNRANHYKRYAPYSSNLSKATIKSILNRAIRQSERYRRMKEMGATPEEIRKAFRTPTEMTVFSYRGDKDTVMTPIDSIRYIKSFLRSAFMSMEAKTGAVKAYVGGIDFDHFKPSRFYHQAIPLCTRYAERHDAVFYGPKHTALLWRMDTEKRKQGQIRTGCNTEMGIDDVQQLDFCLSHQPVGSLSVRQHLARLRTQ